MARECKRVLSSPTTVALRIVTGPIALELCFVIELSTCPLVPIPIRRLRLRRISEPVVVDVVDHSPGIVRYVPNRTEPIREVPGGRTAGRDPGENGVDFVQV